LVAATGGDNEKSIILALDRLALNDTTPETMVIIGNKQSFVY